MKDLIISIIPVVMSLLLMTLPMFLINPVHIKLKSFLLIYSIMVILGYKLFPVSEFVLPIISIIGFFIAVYVNSKRKFISILVSSIAFLISYIADNLLGIICIICGIDMSVFFSGHNWSIYLFYLGIFLIEIPVSLVISYILNKRVKIMEIRFVGRQSVILSAFLIFSIAVYLINTMISKQNGIKNNLLIYNGIIISSYFILIMMIILYLLKNANQEAELQKKKMELKHSEELLAQLQVYTTEIENTYEETRKIRHNFSNILLTISAYLTEMDYGGLEVYFNSNIYPIKDTMNKNQNKLGKLKEIEIKEVKGLLTIKMLEACQSDIDFVMEAERAIRELPMDLLTFCQVLGIVLDNAIEESKLCTEPYIRCAIIDTQQKFELIVKNRCRVKQPLVCDMVRKGFSTKGNHRGLGLYQLNHLINKNEKMMWEIECEDEEFKIRITYYKII